METQHRFPFVSNMPTFDTPSDPRYQCVTYLGADNNTGPFSLPAESPTAAANSGGLAYIAAAAEAASTFPPQAIASSSDVDNLDTSISTGRTVNGPRSFNARDVLDLRELDERVADEACSPAATAQALARVAHRLHEMADDLGGEGRWEGSGAVFSTKLASCGPGVMRCV